MGTRGKGPLPALIKYASPVPRSWTSLDTSWTGFQPVEEQGSVFHPNCSRSIAVRFAPHLEKCLEWVGTAAESPTAGEGFFC